MKIIIKISLLELRKIFLTPVGWILLAIFIIQNSLIFFGQWQQIVVDQVAGFDIPELTNYLFAGHDGVLVSILKSIYWYVPLITMGLISQEKSIGSMKLLQSSPVKNREIVLGKYLMTLAFGIVLLFIEFLLALSTALVIPKLDWGWIFSGLIGIYLLYSAYCAIGLFMSALTRYQVVAAVLTFAMFLALDYIGTLWQNIAIVQDITFFMHISGRADQFLDGLISTRNVIYFFMIIGFFLTLTIWL